jgi:hypothetical protein
MRGKPWGRCRVIRCWGDFGEPKTICARQLVQLQAHDLYDRNYTTRIAASWEAQYQKCGCAKVSQLVVDKPVESSGYIIQRTIVA